MQSSSKDRLTTISKSRSNSMLRPQLRPPNQNSRRQLHKRCRQPCRQTQVEPSQITNNTSKVRMIRMSQSQHLLRNPLMRKSSRSREVAHPRFSNNHKKLVRREEGTAIVSNLLRRKIQTAMMRKMWSSQRKRVKRMIIKIDATYARKLAVFCVAMAALKWRTLHALVSRSPLKETGIVLIVLKSCRKREQLVDRQQCNRVSNSRWAQGLLVDDS